MSDDVSVKIAIALWVGLGVVALLYWTEWDKARREGRALPPHRHPVLLLSRAAQILYRLWPLVAVGVVSGIMATLRLHMWREQQYPGAWPEPTMALLWSHVAQTLTTANWILTSVVFGWLSAESGASGPLMLGIAAAAGGWCAVANPWGLSRRARVLAAAGAVGAVAMAATSLEFLPFNPSAEPSKVLHLLQSVAWMGGAFFTSALVKSLLWWAGVRRPFDHGRFARGAEAAFLVTLVLGAVMSPLSWYSMWLVVRPYEPGAWQMLVSRDLSYAIGFVQVALLWISWVAVSAGCPVLAAIRAGLGLAWRRRRDFAVLVMRVAVLLAPICVFQVALGDVPMPGISIVRSAISSVVGVAFFTAAGLAYASLTDQFPSAVPQAGEEALPPNLPGDIPIAH